MTTTTERARAILALPEAKGLGDLAAHLAHDTSVSVEDAQKTLQGATAGLDALGRPGTPAEAYGDMVGTRRENEARARREADRRQVEHDAGAAAAREALGLPGAP